MPFIVFAILVIIIIMSLGLVLHKSFVSPLFISSISWLVTFVLGMFFYKEFYPLTERVMVCWIVWYFTTSLLFLFLMPNKTIIKTSSLTISFRYSLFIILLSVCLLYRIWCIGTTGPAQFFLNLRLASNGLEGFGSLGLIAYFYPLIVALFVFEQVNYIKIRRRERWCLFFWLLLYGIGTMGKLDILTPILIWGVSSLIQRRVRLSRLIVVAIVSFLFMIIIHFVRSSGTDQTSLFGMLATYTYSPIVAFGYFEPPTSGNVGEYSLRFGYALLYKIGFITTEPKNVILDYVSIPSLTNVYTVMHPFYNDYGLIGVAFFASIYGLLFGGLYKLAYQRNSFYLSCYVSLVIVLFVQFFTEFMFSILSQRLQMIVFLFFLYLIAKRSKV